MPKMVCGKYTIAIHGGAGAHLEVDYTQQLDHMRSLLQLAAKRLSKGEHGVDVLVEVIEAMECSGLYVAGKGSSPNLAGEVELDASVMTGRDKRCGAVAALRGFESPIRIARGVMEDTDHVFLVGLGAEAFANEGGFRAVDNPQRYYSSPEARRVPAGEMGRPATAHGTVGAVVLDCHGDLAAGTSTGGTYRKMAGRVGDTPIIGAGTWADERVAVSCTGLGEAFVRAGSAKDIADRIGYGGQSLDFAVDAMLDEVAHLGGDGGVICVDSAGHVCLKFNSDGMKCGYAMQDGRLETGVFDVVKGPCND